MKFTVLPPLAPAELKFEPERLEFGPYQVGYDPVEPVTFTVTNIGEVDCPDPQYGWYYPEYFDLELVGELDLSAGGVTTFRIKPKDGLEKIDLSVDIAFWDEFDPYDSEDDLSAYLPLSLVITDTPVPIAKLELTPLSHIFDSKEEGYEAVAPVTFTVKNSGTAACSGLKGKLQENSSFEFVKAVPISLDAGASDTFTLRPKAGLPPGTYTETVTVTNGTLTKEIEVAFVVTEKTGETDPGGEDKPDKPENPDNPGGEDKPDKPGGEDKPDKPGGEDKPDRPGGEDKPDNPGGGEDKPTPRPPAGSSSDDDGDGGNDQPPAKTEEKPVDYEEHLPYITGFKDGTFRSEASLTRGQCAAILSRLSGDYDPQKTYGNFFPDVADNSWYVNYVGYLTEKNVIRGYPDGTFRPDEPITRAEFVSLLDGGLGPEKTAENPYPDCGRHWASGSIARLTEEGVLKGYPDGSFRPDIPISRAEAVKAINKAFHRSAEDGRLEAASPFTDVELSNWAYYEILEASIKHRVER